MPFRSRSQQKYLYANEPEVAKKFAEHASEAQYKKLPEHVKKPKSSKKKVKK